MLDEKQTKFVNEYIQSYSIEQAARNAGYPREDCLLIGLDLISNEEIQKAIQEREKQLESLAPILKLDKNKLLMTMYYQYNNASQRRDTKTAIDILEKIAKWSGLNPDEVVLEPVQLIINNVDETKI